MAASSSLFSSSSFQGVMSFQSTKLCASSSNFVYKQPMHLKRSSQNNGTVSCRALEVDKSSSSYSVGKEFQVTDVIEAQQFDRDLLGAIFDVAREMEKIEKKSPGSQILKGYLMATLFYEPSTRTRLSFESAMRRLGGEVLTTENAREFSSAAKGETLEGLHISFHFHSRTGDGFYLLQFGRES